MLNITESTGILIKVMYERQLKITYFIFHLNFLDLKELPQLEMEPFGT